MANRITKADHAGGEDYFVHTFDQLDAIGVSDAVYVHGLSGHTGTTLKMARTGCTDGILHTR